MAASAALFALAFLVEGSAAQAYYGGGDIAGAVLGTFFATLLLVAVGFYLYVYYWKKRKGKNPVLVGDPENVKDEFAFDNPGFKNTEGQPKSTLPQPTGGWPPRINVSNEKTPTKDGGPTMDSRTFLDDTYPEVKRGSVMVPLWSKDFTGLGFEIAGSMRDGIYVARVLRGGPAHESGRIHTGDRINSVRISFRNMVYEDAMSILSFASPYELQLEVQSSQHGLSNTKDIQSRLSTILNGSMNVQRSPGSTLQRSGEKVKKNPGYDSLDKNWKSGTDEIKHPIMGIKRPRCNSNGDANTLEKFSRQHHFSKPSVSPNSTLDSSNQSKNTSLKKMLTDKIINSSTLEKNKPPLPVKDAKNTHMDKEHERNMKNKAKTSDLDAIPKPERVRAKETHINSKLMPSPDIIIIKDGGDLYSAKNEKAEVQKRESDVTKKGMKFGIRVLPPNVPDDVTVNMRNSKYENMRFGNENGNVVMDIKSIDEVDKRANSPTKTTEQTENANNNKVGNSNKIMAPVVAKRREKPAAPIPNARVSTTTTTTTTIQNNVSSVNVVEPEKIVIKTEKDTSEEFARNCDLNSSGIKRDAQGIPQELPQHLMEAAMYARNYRKSHDMSAERSHHHHGDITNGEVKYDTPAGKVSKKSKGKAPSPPEGSRGFDESPDTSKMDDFSPKNMNFTDNFVKNHADVSESSTTQPAAAINRSDDMILNNGILLNTSTPKVEKPVKRMRPDIPVQKKTNNFMIDTMNDSIDIDKSFKPKEMSDSLNNLYDDSKTSEKSTYDVTSVSSYGNDSTVSTDNNKQSSVIELNTSDVMIHNSPKSDVECQEENERKASSLGDLSRLDMTDKSVNNKKNLQGTLERAQSLDISAEESGMEKHITAKKRKSNSVFEGDYYEDTNADTQLDSVENVNQILVHSKEPRLSLDICNLSSTDGMMNKFQNIRLKKASEWGNLEDAIGLKRDGMGSSDFGSSEIENSTENINGCLDTSDNLLGGSSVHEMNDPEHGEISTAIAPVLETFKNGNVSDDATSTNDNHQYNNNNNRKSSDPVSRGKVEIDSNKPPHFEISTYMPDSINMYTDGMKTSSGNISPKMEEKLTMIYDTNIPDDIKVSRHTLVSSLERPKSDLMKKILAQNPALTSDIEIPAPRQFNVDKGEGNLLESDFSKNSDTTNDTSGEMKMNSTLTLLNQPDVVNLRIKSKHADEANDNVYNKSEEFVSNISIIETTPQNREFDVNIVADAEFPKHTEAIPQRNYFSTSDNVVTITTDGSQPSSIITIEGDSTHNTIENFKNSIEINNDDKNTSDGDNVNFGNRSEQGLFNEILSELKKTHGSFNDEDCGFVTRSVEKRSSNEIEDTHINLNERTTTVSETVTFNVIKDDSGDRIIEEKVVNQVVTVTTPATTSNTDITSEIIKTVEESVNAATYVETIETQYVLEKPRRSLTHSENEPSENKDILRKSLEAISDRPINDMPVIMMTTHKLSVNKSLNESSENIMNENKNNDISEKLMNNLDNDRICSTELKDSIEPKDYITEIRVSTSPGRVCEENSDIASVHSCNTISTDEFLMNERRFSANEKVDSDSFVMRRTQSESKDMDMMKNDDDHTNKRHSDYDLPRNTHIKFRTATYEPQNPPPNRLSTDKRLSQIEILKSNFEKSINEQAQNRPSLLIKPSNIPIKLPEKPLSPQKTPVSPSKIPVFNSQNQKSASQENLLDKGIGSQKVMQNNKISSSSGNISITSIKSSSKNPSGK